MLQVLSGLNYPLVAAVALAGFFFGWLWYSPWLFAKPWMAEMKIDEATVRGLGQGEVAKRFVRGFLYTALSSFGLAALLAAHGSAGWVKGAQFGVFVGVTIAGARLLNAGLWEGRSGKLQAITLGHEVALFALQGALLGAWR